MASSAVLVSYQLGDASSSADIGFVSPLSDWSPICPVARSDGRDAHG